ncbi:hypothetical protein EKH79_17770 [Dyella dinghuensis]|uniref:Pr6Pr family membrane protein n=1 Tax=Dyella dinghuensis TaxID=1920169 RepID=A0A3S0QVA5_9GAMM|nr:Pr6Pr family membrane protein [Dyella dinghuensis]RUL61483.1 hypothetical protein EKH79_17770 [Dyella dinghuensis]
MATSGKAAKALLGLTAVVVFVALALQFYLSLRLAEANGKSIGYGVVLYLGFFTITTNLLVLLASVAPMMAPASWLGRFFVRPVAVGWVATSIAFVSVAYFLLLRHVWKPQGLQLIADVLLHYVVPALYVLFSFVALRAMRLRWVLPFWWSIYPLIYFIYAMVRGEVIGAYPYGFIDASALGYATTFRNAVFLLIAFLMLAYLLILLWRVGAEPLSRSDKTLL